MPVLHCIVTSRSQESLAADSNNLAIVENPSRNEIQSSKESAKWGRQASPFSLTTRLKVETTGNEIRVELADIFNSRNEPDGYTLKGLFLRDFFSHTPKREYLTKELEDALHSSEYAKTLLILDGLDEVSECLHKNSEMYSFLEFLLTRPDVIITCRPSARLPDTLRLDLELETLGFYPSQIMEYLKAAFSAPEKVEEIGIFLQEHRLLYSLVRISIQLDALCLIWGEERRSKHASLRTLTTIYIAIEDRLWRKDVDRLDRLPKGKAEEVGKNEMKGFNGDIVTLLGCLAFNGMYHNVVEFQPEYRDVVLEYVGRYNNNLTLSEILEKVSFLRTSDPLLKPAERSYHFLHLTYQEYFAAKYFVQHWPGVIELEYHLDFKDRESNIKTSPKKFLQKFKYDERYDMVWRFATGLLDKGEGGTNDQQTALDALRSLPDLPDRIVDALLPLLRNAGHAVQKKAAKILAHQSKLSKEAKATLKTLAENSNASIQYTAAVALNQQSHLPNYTFTAFIQLLKSSGNWHLREQATDALGEQSNFQCFTADIMLLLKDEDYDTRGRAVRVLGKQFKLSKDTTNTLKNLLHADETGFRNHAAEVIAEQSNPSSKTLEDLIMRLEKKKRYIREIKTGDEKYPLFPGLNPLDLLELSRAVETDAKGTISGKAGQVSQSGIEALTKILEGSMGWVAAAADALSDIPNLPKATIQALITVLQRQYPDNQHEAIRVLETRTRLSDEAGTVLVSLLKGLGQDYRRDTAMIRGVAKIIMKVSSNWSISLIGTFVPLLADTDMYVRFTAARVLGMQSKIPEEIVVSIVKQLEHENQGGQFTTTRAIGMESVLIDKILEALEVSSGSERSLGQRYLLPANKNKGVEVDRQGGSLTRLATVRSLYGSFLVRSFREHLWLEINEDSSLSVHLPNGSRKTILGIGSEDEVLSWQRLWIPEEYQLYNSIE
ncbi:hypothetical protein NUW58_g1175 [Xylaria curta]|uniref:Uncharacterized protein n=1 Tax=Xylaria curta TaxID=42375 RepID=A0ACC1PLY4_9PEZI|nr:hypothetical protein NUW58_g1175 [Xylaria curta]